MRPHQKLFIIVLLTGTFAANAFGQFSERVLIRSAKPYTDLVNAITADGGKVTHQYKYVDAIAAELPATALTSVSALVAPGAISKDPTITGMQPVAPRLAEAGVTASNPRAAPSSSVLPLSATDIQAIATSHPEAYGLNDPVTRASSLHATGILGTGVVVAVIDTGIRPGFPNISLDGAVIGCEDLVGDGLGCSNTANDGHGTAVAGLVAGNALFGFPSSSAFRLAVKAECPGCFLQVAGSPPDTFVPMIGSAPGASIYALRIYNPSLQTTRSRILTAMERVIELRESGVNIRAANLSFGGTTANPGDDLLDEAADRMLAAGIVPVAAASNSGPSSLTISPPGSSRSALTVGAASLPQNERTFYRMALGSVGALVRPFLGVQTAYFSARGPLPDGRIDPDAIANGVASYTQGYETPDNIFLGDGTSASTPTASGIVALLAQVFPNATAVQLLNAIRMSANRNVLSDGSTYLDQGAGYIDAVAARNILAAGGVPNALPAVQKPNTNVKVNIEQNTFLKVRDGFVEEDSGFLKPGGRHELLYQVPPNTSQIIITLDNIRQSLPPAQQNPIFGDDLLVTVHSPEFSNADYNVFEYTLTGKTWVISDPQPGIMRITLSADTFAAGSVAGTMHVVSTTDPLPRFTTQGKILNLQISAVPVSVPAGVGLAEFRLSWRGDWASFPTNDVDLYLITPGGSLVAAGATLRDPEVVKIANPSQGTWQALILGFNVWTGEDKFEFRATLDGKVVK